MASGSGSASNRAEEVEDTMVLDIEATDENRNDENVPEAAPPPLLAILNRPSPRPLVLENGRQLQSGNLEE